MEENRSYIHRTRFLENSENQPVNGACAQVDIVRISTECGWVVICVGECRVERAFLLACVQPRNMSLTRQAGGAA